MTNLYKMKKYKLKYIMQKMGGSDRQDVNQDDSVASTSVDDWVVVEDVSIPENLRTSRHEKNYLYPLTFLIRGQNRYYKRCLLSFSINSDNYLMDISLYQDDVGGIGSTFKLYYGSGRHEGLSPSNFLNADDEERKEARVRGIQKDNILNNLSDYLGHIRYNTSGFVFRGRVCDTGDSSYPGSNNGWIYDDNILYS